MKKIVILSVLVVALCALGCRRQEQAQQAGYPAGTPMMPTLTQINELQAAAKASPKDPQAWIALGNGMMDSQRCEEAIKAYKKALALEPKNVNVRVDMGTCYRRVGKYEEAVKEYKKALKIDPSHLNAHRNLGVVLINDLHRTAEGVKEFKKYLELAPNAPDAGAVKQKISELTGGN
jgi:cytochrome c-type biogenesis protein CcmH/NrfG